MMSKRIFNNISLGAVLLLVNLSAFAAPKSELWPIWNSSNENNAATVDHQKWQQIIDNLMVTKGEQNLINYAAATKKDQQLLKQYISDLAGIDPRRYNKKEQFSYWVNLYNALTVQLILDNYPLTSITKLGGFFNFGPWDDKVITIANQSLTLNDIEHRILRPIWQDPRIHYAVNCASLGCPNLANSVFTAENNDKLLTLAAKQFTNSNKGARIDGDTLTLSSIYDWYGVDFGNNQQQILQHIDRYRDKSAIDGQKLADWKGKIKYAYDWTLNQP